MDQKKRPSMPGKDVRALWTGRGPSRDNLVRRMTKVCLVNYHISKYLNVADYLICRAHPNSGKHKDWSGQADQIPAHSEG